MIHSNQESQPVAPRRDTVRYYQALAPRVFGDSHAMVAVRACGRF